MQTREIAKDLFCQYFILKNSMFMFDVYLIHICLWKFINSL